jgi:predicted nucleotidyltransferase
MPGLGIIIPNMGMRSRTTSRKPRRRVSVGIRGVPEKPPSSLVDALFTSTQRRTLGLLFGQPSRSFFANELIALTGSGSGAVQRELRRLEDSGLVTTTKVGSRKYYQANAAAPLFHELRSIIRKTVGLAQPLKAVLDPLARHIQLALVYGSVAKRTDTANSDVDLLIVSDDLTLEQAYAAIAPAEQELSRKISVNLYTTGEFARRREADNPFLSRVFAGERIVLLGSEDGAAAA